MKQIALWSLLGLLLLLGSKSHGSKSTKQLDETQITTKNWLQVGKETWPSRDTRQRDESPFYYFHEEESLLGPQFGLNTSFFANGTILSGIDLSFEYWSTSTSGEFQTHDALPNNPKPKYQATKLTQKGEWTPMEIRDITELQWDSFLYLNTNPYTIAFKDVKATFTEKILRTSLPPDPIHSYQDHGFIQTDGLSVFAKSVTVQFDDIIDLLTERFTFHLRIPSLAIEEQISLRMSPDNPSECQANSEIPLPQVSIKCYTGPFRSPGVHKEFLNSLDIRVTKEFQPQVPLLELRDFAGQFTGLNLEPVPTPQAQSLVAYLIDSQPPNLDVCYKIQKYQDKELTVYLTLANQTTGSALKTITGGPGEQDFCLSDFVALRNLRRYQLTFEVPIDPKTTHNSLPKQPNFAVIRTTRPGGQTFRLLRPGPKPNLIAWFYGNVLFDYSFTTGVIPVVGGLQNPQFKLCDATLNCFRFRKSSSNVGHRNETNSFTLPAAAHTILTRSPFLRLDFAHRRPYDVNNVNHFFFSKFNFTYNRIPALTQASLLSHVLSLNPGLTSTPKLPNPTTIIITHSLPPTTTQLSLKIPLHPIDFRIYHLITTLVPKNPADTLTLKQVTFQLDNSQTPSDLTSLFPLSSSPISLSTESLFHAPPHSTTPNILGTLTLLLDLSHASPSTGTSIDLTLRLIDNKVAPREFPVTLPPQKFTLNSNNPKIVIKTGLIRSPANRRLPNLNIKLKFTSLSQDLTANDLSVTQILLSQGSLSETPKTSNLQLNKTTAFFTQNPDDEPLTITGPAFEIIYTVQLKTQTLQLEVSLQQLQLTLEAPKHPQKGPYLATSNPLYDPFSCPVNYEPTQSGTCTWTTTYRSTSLSCLPPTCSNIFNATFGSSTLYFNPSSHTNGPFLPFLPKPSLNPWSAYLTITRPKEMAPNEPNFCIQFNYLAQNIPLTLTSTPESPQSYAIEYPKTHQNTQIAQLCVAELSPDPSTVKGLFFHFLASPLNANYHQVSNIQLLSPKPVPALLPNGIPLNKLDPSQFWTIDPNFLSINQSSIIYHATELQARKVLQSNGTLITALRTKWIAVPANKPQLRLSLISQIDPKDVSLYRNIIFTISTSNQTNLITKNLTEISSNQMHTFPVPPWVKFYQLTLRIELDPSQIQAQESSTITLTNFTINDPCLTQNSALEQCSTHGRCLGDYHHQTPLCACATGYLGPDCSQIDYCHLPQLNPTTKEPYTNGQKFCQILQCVSKPETESFTCVCPKTNEHWDSVNSRCLPPVIQCPENQIFTLENSPNSGACQCDTGFIRNSTEACEPFDICNQIHRKQAHLLPTSPCLDPHATCTPSNSSLEYECKCSSNYYNQFKLTSRSAKCLPIECQNCEQFCTQNTTTQTFGCSCAADYALQPSGACLPLPTHSQSKCTSQNQTYLNPKPFQGNLGVCQCPESYQFYFQTKTCLPDPKLAQQFGCTSPQVEIKPQDGQPGCICLPGQAFNPKSRSCLPQCDPTSTQTCSRNHNALCSFKTGPRCICPPSQIAYGPNSTIWTCLDKCTQFLATQPEQTCTKQFTACNPATFHFDPETQQSNFFIESQSRILSNAHCQCEPGFESAPSDAQCRPSKVPIRYVKKLEFELKTKNQIKQIQSAFSQLLTSLFSTSTLIDPSCVPAANPGLIQCSSGFPTQKSVSSVEAILNGSCTLLPESQKCVYLTQEEANQGLANYQDLANSKLVGILIRPDVRAAITVEKFNYCSNPTLCTAFPYSTCHPTSTSFSCLCNPNYFTVEKTQQLDPRLTLETCEPKDLCTDYQALHSEPYCVDPQATCHYSLLNNPNDPNLSPNLFCFCPKQNYSLPSRGHACTNNCGNFCANNGTCAQDLFDPQKIICNCPPGYSGPKCETQTKTPSNNTSKALLIANIVVSVIAALAIASSGFLLYKLK